MNFFDILLAKAMCGNSGGKGVGLTLKVVSSVSQVTSDKYLYLVRKESAKEGDVFDEYVFVDGKAEKIGSTVMDLKDYVKNTDYANNKTGGVFKVSTSHGVNMSADGFLMGATRTAEQYNSNSGNMLINKGTLENVFDSRSEDWEFTLSDGSTVTKKILVVG